jgi:hypothetical protein
MDASNLSARSAGQLEHLRGLYRKALDALHASLSSSDPAVRLGAVRETMTLGPALVRRIADIERQFARREAEFRKAGKLPIDLKDTQKEILAAMPRNEVVKSEWLARRMDRDNDSYLRAMLLDLVRKGILQKGPAGRHYLLVAEEPAAGRSRPNATVEMRSRRPA